MKPPLSLSRHWPIHIRSAMMSVVSLAHAALTHSRSYAVNSPIERVRIAEDRDRFQNETSLLKEELRIKDARMSRIDPKHRPYYTCVERLQILELRAARALSAAQTARMFHVEPVTVRLWMKRVDAQDAKPLIQLPVPVNKFSDYVRYVVQRLKVLCPAAGKIRIAQILARAGLSISPSTVLRILKSKPVQPTPADSSISPTGKDPSPDRHFVTANYPHHLWHVDLTVVPLFAGFWIPWLPFARLQTWPFCWWVACVIDHFSRCVVGFRLFHNQPTARQVRAVLSRAIRKSKRAPKYIVSDKGPQFWCDSTSAVVRGVRQVPALPVERLNTSFDQLALSVITSWSISMDGGCRADQRRRRHEKQRQLSLRFNHLPSFALSGVSFLWHRFPSYILLRCSSVSSS